MVTVQASFGGGIQTATAAITDKQETALGAAGTQSAWGGGDTVSFSAEALTLLKTKLEEYGAEDPADLSAKERDEIAQAMETAEGVTAQDRESLAQLAATAGQEGAASQDQTGTGTQSEGQGDGASASGQSGGGSGSAESSDSSDTIEELEQNIEEVKQEIEELQAKAATDEESKEKMKAKQMELSMLEAQLALLESQSEQSSGA